MILVTGETLLYTRITAAELNEATQGISLPSLKKRLSDILAFPLSLDLQSHTLMIFRSDFAMNLS